MKEISLYFFRLRASFLRNSAIFSRISSQVISGMDLTEYLSLLIFPFIGSRSRFFNSLLKNVIEKFFPCLKLEADFCRDCRNRVIAHKDFYISLKTGNAAPVIPANRKKVKAVLSAIHGIIQLIETKLTDYRSIKT
jgi:hypothetical protein